MSELELIIKALRTVQKELRRAAGELRAVGFRSKRLRDRAGRLAAHSQRLRGLAAQFDTAVAKCRSGVNDLDQAQTDIEGWIAGSGSGGSGAFRRSAGSAAELSSGFEGFKGQLGDIGEVRESLEVQAITQESSIFYQPKQDQLLQGVSSLTLLTPVAIATIRQVLDRRRSRKGK